MKDTKRNPQIKEETMKQWDAFIARSLAVLCLSLAGASAALADAITITAQPNPAVVGEAVIFTITPKIGLSDTLSITFGDNTPTLAFRIQYDFDMGCMGPCGLGHCSCGTTNHVYSAPGTYTVSFKGALASGGPFSGALQVTVGSGMEVRGLFVPTAAHLTGHNNVNWRTDLEVQNPGSAQARFSIALLARGQDNTTPARADLTLDPGQAVRYPDILQTLFGFSGAAALCIVPVEGTVVATSRTYAETVSGTYGSFVPVVARDNAIALGEDGRLIGLSHDPSLSAGFRTNIGLVNANAYPLRVAADFYFAGGTLLGTASYDLQAFEFRQIDRAFEQFTRERVDNGYAVIRMAPGAGGQMLDATARLIAYASVVDNVTGDPAYVPAIATAQPEGDISGYWSGNAFTHAPDDCSAPTNASATFTQDGVSVTGTLGYGSSADCGVNWYTFDGTLFGNALVGTLTHGTTAGTLKGMLSGASLELAAGSLTWNPTNPWFRFEMHLHR